MHSLRQRPARIVAALCGLIALLVLGVSSAAVDAPAPQPRIIPLSGSMSLGGTSTVTTALLSPEGRIRVANCESASQVGPTGRPYK